MGQTTETETHIAAKRHQCGWCAEAIEVGDKYIRYRWFDMGDAGTVKLHPECSEAATDDYIEWGDEDMPPAGCNPRGCNCGFDADCEKYHPKILASNAELTGDGLRSSTASGAAHCSTTETRDEN